MSVWHNSSFQLPNALFNSIPGHKIMTELMFIDRQCYTNDFHDQNSCWMEWLSYIFHYYFFIYFNAIFISVRFFLYVQMLFSVPFYTWYQFQKLVLFSFTKSMTSMCLTWLLNVVHDTIFIYLFYEIEVNLRVLVERCWCEKLLTFVWGRREHNTWSKEEAS
jgi:hypothetical protein